MTNRIVTKALAGIEDLLLGTGTVNQVRNGVTKSIKKIDAAGLIYENAETMRTRFGKKVEVLTNVAALQALDSTVAAEKYVYLLGYTTSGDGGGGLFWLDSTDTTSVEDLNIVFNPDVLANGRWKRVDTSQYLSPDRGDVNYTVQAFDFGTQLFDTPLSTNRTVTLPITGLFKGKLVSILRTTTNAFVLDIGGIVTLSSAGTVTVQYDGTSWIHLNSAITGSSSSGAGNVPANGSFEFDTNSDSIPDNWTLSKLTNAIIKVDSAVQVDGLKSLKFESAGAGGGTAISKKFDIGSAKNIAVHFSHKSSLPTTLNKVEIRTYNKNNANISTILAWSDDTYNPSVFAAESVKVTLPYNTAQADLVLTGIDAAGTVTVGATSHFDGVSIDQDFVLSTGLPDIADSGKEFDLTTVVGGGTQALTLSKDGTKAYFTYGTVMYMLNLAIAWDISSATDSGDTHNLIHVAANDGIAFSPDGLNMYLLDQINENVYQYTLTNPWDISTGIAYTGNTFTFTAWDGSGSPGIMQIDDNGRYIMLHGNAGDIFIAYSMSIPWDLSTASYVGQFSHAAITAANLQGAVYINEGRNVIFWSTAAFYQLRLATAYAVHTAVYDGKFVNDDDVKLGTQVIYQGIVSPDNRKLIVADQNAALIHQFDLGRVQKLR